MNAKTLKLLVIQAHNREEAALQALRATQGKLRRAAALQQQLEDFGQEYRQAALDAQRSGGRVGFAMDAQAFGQRLHGTAGEQRPVIADHTATRDQQQQQAIALQHRREGLEKLLQAALRLEQRQVDRHLQKELDDVINARCLPGAGMNAALKTR